jgi:ABC-2 type transport system ATP-binding protein
VICASGLGRRFGSRWAVQDVSLEIRDGTLLALLGPNGAGKTTTVRMLSGLLTPTVGSANVAGCDVGSAPAAVRARVGLVTDVPGLYEQMTPSAYLQFFGRLYGLEAPALGSRIDSLLELFELDARAQDRMATFSRGMQQKVALARALLHEPAVLFLDEPTAGLDPLAARSVRELVLGLKHARRSIVLCTHDLDEAERLADQIAIMQGGRILALDTSANLRQLASPNTRVVIQLAPPFVASAPTGFVEYMSSNPNEENPQRIAELVAQGARVVSLTCRQASLEDVYAAAIHGELRGGALQTTPNTPTFVPAAAAIGEAAALWLIARRAALESLNDQFTRLMNVFLAILAPIALVVFVRSALPVYLLVIGTLPAVGAVGIAAGQFAGERERGVLTPMLASPASNLSIFGGKVLGSMLPPLLYSLIAEGVYLGSVAVVLGPAALGPLVTTFSAAIIVLVALVTCLAAIIATLVSSRVRTYNAAQQISGILVIPVWGAFLTFGAQLQSSGAAGWAMAVLALACVDIGLMIAAAKTWRREEVLSRA